MRILLYTGKGGVGKTSVAAATALRAARLGYRTLVMSTDMAHSLADAFDLPLDSRPVPIAPNLWGQEIDVLKEAEAHWATVRDWLSALMQWQGVEEVVAEELAVLPGMDELVGLLYIARYYDEGEYDLLVVDCAPTGETLRLLSFPEMARWYMEHLFPIGKRATQVLGPLARTVLGLPAPDEKVLAAVEDLYHRLDRMRAILADREASSVRLVVNPERMVIKETQRTFTYLNLYGYATDLVVCNRMVPQAVSDAYFDAWKEAQARHLALVRECFHPIPVLVVPLMSREVVGTDALEEMAHLLYGEEDPTRWFYRGQPYQVKGGKDGRVLLIHLPFVERGEVSLSQRGAELVIQAGRYRRNILLPQALAGLEVREARREGETLRILFQAPEEKP